mmetsp:Transcript_20612/g.64765  ORF Transcript_20612/g.64765 Transcript_20612/m.64765 type:complete len:281 (+) Transcript_20612:180-1022(+)
MHVPLLRRAMLHIPTVVLEVPPQTLRLHRGHRLRRTQDDPLDVLCARRYGHTAVVEVGRPLQRFLHFCLQVDGGARHVPVRTQVHAAAEARGVEAKGVEDLAAGVGAVAVHHAHDDAGGEHVLGAPPLVEDHQLGVVVLALESVEARRRYVHLTGFVGDGVLALLQLDVPEAAAHARRAHVPADVHRVGRGALVRGHVRIGQQPVGAPRCDGGATWKVQVDVDGRLPLAAADQVGLVPAVRPPPGPVVRRKGPTEWAVLDAVGITHRAGFQLLGHAGPLG